MDLSKNRFKILLSRTDSIGDVMLTLPMAGFIKKHLPTAQIIFLGRSYTEPVIRHTIWVDQFINYDELLKKTERARRQFIQELELEAVVHVFPVKEIAWLMKRAGIKIRIGTSHRFYHWFTCNIRPALSRRNSNLHEAQLNLLLLEFLKLPVQVPLMEISSYYGFQKFEAPLNPFIGLMDKNRKKVILHPKSKGSAREWGLENFLKLIEDLPEEKFQIFITGTADEGRQLKPLLESQSKATDLTGKMTLEQYIHFIRDADALVAGSTGPLHIAAALGITAIGLYAPMFPIHPGRWMPLGSKAHHLVLHKNCSACRKTADCECIRAIPVKEVVHLLK